MRQHIKIFARIGELIQGMLPDQTHFLVSGLPSRLFFSEAILEDAPFSSIDLPPKALLALHLLLRTYAGRPGVSGEELVTDLLREKKLSIHSNIPPGKGLSSSSTDLLSVLFLVNEYLHAGLGTGELYKLAVEIEPTDPCLSDEVLLFYQREGRVARSFSLPPLSIVYFDPMPGTGINTLDLERKYDAGQRIAFEGLLRRWDQAVAEKDLSTLLSCVTQSAVYNQAILALPHFDRCLQVALKHQAGLTVAHSGTIVGFITGSPATKALLSDVQELANPDRTTGASLETRVYSETWDPR